MKNKWYHAKGRSKQENTAKESSTMGFIDYTGLKVAIASQKFKVEKIEIPASPCNFNLETKIAMT